MSLRVSTCPNCGAQIRFLWSSSVQTTCDYCRSILVRHDVNLDKVGQVADLPPDSSPIQIGTEGIWNNQAFIAIGRIMYEYELGYWNEWHLVFNDGSSGWLSDAQLEYAISFLTKPPAPLPPLNEVFRAKQYQWNGAIYEVTSITDAHYRGVQGELPFEYWDKSETRFVDLRTTDARFGTIDYSEKPALLFLGHAVEYEQLRLKNVRQFEGWS